MEVYLIKYALEKGVQKIEVEKDKNCDIYYQKITSYSSIGYLSDDFCLTHEEARLKANQMRIDKINVLNAEIDELRKLNFFL